MYIQLTNVSKKIKSNDILKDINLRMESGKIYGFKGKNGCGKTMLMRAISGLIKVKGTVDINGQIIGKDIMFPPSIGLLIENPSFIPVRYLWFAVQFALHREWSIPADVGTQYWV